MPNDKIEVATMTLKTIWIAWTWWASYYLYNVHRWTKFKIWLFITNIILAWFVGFIVWWMLPLDFSMRDSFIAMSWFSAFPILALIENKFPKILGQYMKIEDCDLPDNKNKKWQ